MNPSGCVHFARICAANNAEAERILARHATGTHVDHDGHVWPDAKPAVDRPRHHERGWHETPPKTPGRYRWRLNPTWEEVQRKLDSDGQVYSHRFVQYVDAIRVGGEWFY